MKKDKALEIISDEGPKGATALMRQIINEELWGEYMIVLVRCQIRANCEENDNDSHWVPLVIHKPSMTQHDCSGRMQSQDARVIIDGSMSGAGYAFQSKTGSWTWATD